MTIPTTITVTVRVDMQDQLAGFVTNKAYPAARLRVADQHITHRFTRPDEQHSFRITVAIDPGEHEIHLEYTETEGILGAIEVLSVEVDGSPIGPDIYECEYRPFNTSKPRKLHTYMEWPGRWTIRVRTPAHRHMGTTAHANRQFQEIWDRHADPEHIRHMARHIWGEDSEAAMAQFRPSESLLMKYENNIVNCVDALRGQRVLDMGCNHGLYAYMALRHGASHVMGVEPRGMYVQGLNTFAQSNDLAMEFRKGHDTDLARLVREHNTDTVILMDVDDITNWENMMYDLRKSDVQWIIMQMTALPDTWLDFNQELREYALSGPGMPAGFTLHYDSYNSDTRGGLNPLHKDSADPDTGYQHLDHDGNFDRSRSHHFRRLRSRSYIRKFIDHVGFHVERSVLQSTAIQSTGRLDSSASNGLFQWYLLENTKK
jgi:hypothetical protein